MAASPGKVFFNQRVVLYRNFTVPLRAGQFKSLYADGEIEKWLLPLLQTSNRVGELGIIRHQWRHRDSLLLWLIAMMVGMLLFALVLHFL